MTEQCPKQYFEKETGDMEWCVRLRGHGGECASVPPGFAPLVEANRQAAAENARLAAQVAALRAALVRVSASSRELADLLDRGTTRYGEDINIFSEGIAARDAAQRVLDDTEAIARDFVDLDAYAARDTIRHALDDCLAHGEDPDNVAAVVAAALRGGR